MLPEVEEAWVAAVRTLRANPGNPAALHGGGRTAKRMLEDARERVGAALGAERAEVVFTSGATESCALGVSGAARGCVPATLSATSCTTPSPTTMPSPTKRAS